MGSFNNNEFKIKSEFFGKVKKIEVSSEHIIKKELLEEPFEKNDTVARCFCEGCGVLYEINKELSDNLSEKAGVNNPDLLEKKYFKVKGCGACNNEDESVELKDF